MLRGSVPAQHAPACDINAKNIKPERIFVAQVPFGTYVMLQLHNARMTMIGVTHAA